MDEENEISGILQGFQKTCILITANELNLFDQLVGEPISAESAANNLNASIKGTERLLNALCGMGFINKSKGRYQLLPNWRDYLTQDGKKSMRQWIQLSADLSAVWNELPEFIQTGTMQKSIMDVLGTDPEKMTTFTNAMHDKALKATHKLAQELPIGDAKNMLDAGGGPGTYSLEWCKLYPELKATIFDIPPVLEVTKQYIKRYELEDRVTTKPGNLGQDDLGDGYDLVLLANILHMYDHEWAKQLVQKAYEALTPGGRIVIHGFCTDEEGTAPLNDAIFSLNIGILTEGGRAHPVEEKLQWLEECGFKDVRSFRVDATPTGVITGVKP